jgi:tetratricopeptide (TPR) repeat protein
MEKNETVGTEPLGYLSYYSRRIVYDWPGLCSRKVVEYSKARPREERTLLKMLGALRPDFLVLRYYEYDLAQNERWVDDEYRVIASFEVPYDRNDPLFKMNMDMGFLVLAKRTWHPEKTDFDGQHLGVNPKHARALNSLAQRLVQRGKIKEGELAFEMSVAANPNFAEARNNLGLALSNAGDKAGALTQFMKAVELDPDYAQAHNNLGVTFLDLGNVANGTKHLQEAIRCDATYVEPILNLADLIARHKNLAGARRLFEEVLKIEPVNAGAKDGIRKIDEAMSKP